MKKNASILFVFAALALGSCAKKNLGFFNNNYERYNARVENSSIENKELVQAPLQENLTASSDKLTSESELQVPVSTQEVKVAQLKKLATKAEVISNPATKAQVKTLKREIKKELKELKSEENSKASDRSFIWGLILVILAVILPPLAVALVDGISGPFWLSILLTIIFWVPGVIYALYRIFKD